MGIVACLCVNSSITQDQDGGSIFHCAGGLKQKFVQGFPEGSRASVYSEAQIQSSGGPTLHLPHGQVAQIFVEQQGAGQVKLSRVLRCFGRKIQARSQVSGEGHDQSLPDRVNGRIRHLGETLLEVREEQTRLG